MLIGSVADLLRSKADLIAENALLRHQSALLKRQPKRPRLKPADRLSLLLLAKVTKTWRQTLLIVQPATLLRTPSGASLASRRLSLVLEVDESKAMLAAADPGGEHRVDPAAGCGDPAMACGADLCR
jgi:hypothetical protein